MPETDVSDPPATIRRMNGELPRPEHPHTTEQAAEALGVPAGAIRKWAHRRKITACGYLAAGAPRGAIPLYRLDELRPLADRYRATGIPRLHGDQLVARCVCGTTRTVPTTTVSNGPACDTCGLETAEGLLQGPDRHGIYALMHRTFDDSNNVVYFARIGNLIKIGTTSNLPQRLASLGNPELLGVIPGGYKVETKQHRRFKDELVAGREVFEATPRLLDYIEKHCTMPELPDPPEPKPRPSVWVKPHWNLDR